MFLYGTTCTSQCSTDNKMVGQNGVCIACSRECLTCVNQPDSCLACAEDKLFYNYTCSSACPAGYEANADAHCVIKGLRCPFGQAVNALGNGCELKVQVCENGFTLNVARDKCVPGPGSCVPFPMIITICVLSLPIWLSYYRTKQTRVSTNLIAVISFIESVGIFVQTIEAYNMGVYSTFALTLLSLLFTYGCNMFFCIIYLKQVATDQAFKYWAANYSMSQNAIIAFGSLVNFKMFRLSYGRFLAKDYFNAVFEDPEIFFKPFTFISVFSILTTMMPLLVANIIGLVFIDFGYQVQMSCIELTIIEIVLLALMIYEKIKLKKMMSLSNPIRVKMLMNLTW